MNSALEVSVLYKFTFYLLTYLQVHWKELNQFEHWTVDCFVSFLVLYNCVVVLSLLVNSCRQYCVCSSVCLAPFSFLRTILKLHY